ncbi:Hypothetical protein PHPALM_9327 [Phytophthora palmivora]|uniref:PiggyBac transposable element-derived protein domain-containing protein n=1 Tax=Phytophthora palmivora TaxID=4796 RepID=A0A2P4Y7K3_9STRA|nr:Hypothetical protein PHPALM_9327 [Phytophthora palmivora]
MREDGWNFDAEIFPEDEEYPDLFGGEYGPTDEVLSKAESPLDLIFFFMRRSLWSRIAYESNRYYNQPLNERADRMYQKQLDGGKQTTREEVMDNETKKHKPIKRFEIVRCIGLLVARMLCPHSRRLADHWATSTAGAVPAGTFGRYASKAWFGRVMQNLPFSNNTDPRAETDRA